MNCALAELDPEFQAMYSHTGRPSIAPEKLLKGLLLQAFYSIRSNRLLVEQIGYNVLFRWFLGLSLDEKVWDHSVFSVNQKRLIETDIARKLLAKVAQQARKNSLLSDDHFSVDGTLIEAWASIKSFRPKDEPPQDDPPQAPKGRNEERDFHGKKLKNDTHASTTDSDANLYKKGKGKEAKLSYMGHALMENRNGLIVDVMATTATGTAERDAATIMVADLPRSHRITVAGDKGYDTQGFVEAMRDNNATPHVARKTIPTALQRSTAGQRAMKATRSASGFAKRIEEAFGWIKVIGNLRKTRHRGVDKVDWYFTLTAAAYNLVRMRKLGVASSL